MMMMMMIMMINSYTKQKINPESTKTSTTYKVQALLIHVFQSVVVERANTELFNLPARPQREQYLHRFAYYSHAVVKRARGHCQHWLIMLVVRNVTHILDRFSTRTTHVYNTCIRLYSFWPQLLSRYPEDSKVKTLRLFGANNT